MYAPYSVFTFIYYYWKWAIIWNMECGSTLHINFTYKYRFQSKKDNISYFKRIPLIWHDMGNTMTLLFFFTISINISYFLGHWLYKGQQVYSIINIAFNLWTDFVWSVSMSPCVSMSDLCEVSLCLHVDMDMECLHVSMWIWTWSVSMSLCVSMSPCGYGHRVYYELHGDFHVDMDSHMEISMVLDRYYEVWYSSMWGIMCKYEAISNSVCCLYIKYLIVKSFYYKSSKWRK